jgi:serine protease Do
MDIEKLTKQQIILVTLLVSFVTSIATGIVTVALMDQAPAGVTQTINRVVERTIEKAVTPPTSGNAAAVVTRETVVVKEDDKIVESVDKNKTSVVRIYTDTPDPTQRVFVGLGTIVSKDGLIATGDVFADLSGKYLVSLDGTKFYSVTVLAKPTDNKFYFLKVIQDPANVVVFTPVTFSNSDNLKLGQTIIAWGGEARNSVSTGIISSLVDIEGKTNQASSTASSTATSTATSTLAVRQIVGITTNTILTDSLAGGPLLNLNGEVVGIRVNTTISDKYTFLPVNLLKNEATGL